MAKLNPRAWQSKIQILVWRMTGKKSPMHRRRVASFLEELAARLREETDKTQSTLVGTWPDMPPKIFSACVRVEYRIGIKLQDEAMQKAKIIKPKRIRMSAEARQKWLQVVMEEIVTK